MKSVPTKVITGPKCRSSFMYVNKLEKDDNDVNKCRTQVLIPKSDTKTVNAMKAAIDEASMVKFGKKALKTSSKFNYPLRDGDQELEDEEIEGEHYKGHYFLSATAYKVPGLVDKSNTRIEDPDEREEVCVSGNHFRFSLTVKGFDNESKGIRVLLNNLMFIKEGERLDGGMKAEDEFEAFEDSDDDDVVVDDDDDDDDAPRKSKRKSRRKGRRG
jgi:hypothetical protein